MASRPVCNRVPRTQIVAAEQWDLRPPMDMRSDAHPKPLKKPPLGRIPDGIATWVQPEARLQPYGRAQTTNLPDGHVLHLAAFESTDLARGHGRRAPEVSLTDPGANARVPDFGDGGRDQPAGGDLRASLVSLPGGHGGRMPGHPLLALISPPGRGGA